MPKEHLESHMTAHSSEILPWLYLGGHGVAWTSRRSFP